MTRRTHLRRLCRRLLRWGRLGLCVSLAVFLAINPNLVHRQLAIAQTKAEIEAKQKKELEELAAKLEKLFDALEKAQKQIPRETFDPKVIIEGQPEVGFEGVGKDPEKIFEWVRDNTFLVPYRGVLRDYKGVLMDRVGNSLDRALLLFVLLREADHQSVRLAHAVLSDEKAAELLQKRRVIPNQGALPRVQFSTDQLTSQLQRVVETFDVDPGELRRVIDESQLKSQSLAQQVVQRTSEQSKILIEMLREHIPSQEHQMKMLRADAINGLKHHWWVQLETGTGIVDLDPSVPDTEPGKSFVEMQDIVPGSQLTNLLGNERHTIKLKVIIERQKVDGTLVELPVLTQELFPPAIIGERIAIHHVPPPGDSPKNLDFAHEDKPLEKLKEVILKQREWIPVLSVGKNRISQYGFTDEGETTNPKLPAFAKNVMAGRQVAKGLEAGVKSLGELFKRLVSRTPVFESETSPPKDPNDELEPNMADGTGQVTAEWIEYELRVPGEKPKSIRRQIFDLIGPAARFASRNAELNRRDAKMSARNISKQLRRNRAFALAGKTEILPTMCQLSPEYLADLQIQKIKELRSVMRSLLENPNLEVTNAPVPNSETVKLIPSQLLALAHWRSECSLERGYVYFDRLNVLSFHQFFSNNSGKELVAIDAFDIVANGVAVVPSASAEPYAIRLRQGVLDTNVEALLLAGDHRKQNTAEFFASSFAGDINWIVIKDSEFPQLVNDKPVEDFSVRIRDEVANGNLVVAPASENEVPTGKNIGWWRIHRQTGQTLGIGDRGWGQVSVERVLHHSAIDMGAYAFCLTLHQARHGNIDQTARLTCFFTTALGAGVGYLAESVLVGLTVHVWIDLNLPGNAPGSAGSEHH